MSCLSKGERESSCGLFCALGLDLPLEVEGDGDGDGVDVDVNMGVVVGANGNVCDGASSSSGNSRGTGSKIRENWWSASASSPAFPPAPSP